MLKGQKVLISKVLNLIFFLLLVDKLEEPYNAEGKLELLDKL